MRDTDAPPSPPPSRRSADAHLRPSRLGGPSRRVDPARHGRRARDHARRRHRPVRRRPVPRRAERPLILPRGDDPRFSRSPRSAACPVRRASTSSSRPSTASCSRSRRDAPVRERRHHVFVVASERRRSTCLDKWVLAERCRARPRPDTGVVERRVRDPAAVWCCRSSSSRARAAARVGSCVERPLDLDALARDTARSLSRSTSRAPEHSLDVLARADGHVAAVVPRARLKVDRGIACRRRALHDAALDTFAREVAALIALTTVANVQVEEAGDSTRLPHDADHRRRRRHAGWRSARRSARRFPMARWRSPTSPWCVFQERFFSFDDIDDLQGDAAPIVA